MDFLGARIDDRVGGGSGRCPAPSNTGAQLTYRLRDIETWSRSTHRNSITWASASRSGARRWPMPTKGATGVSMRRWPSGSVRRRRTGVGPDQYRLRPGLDDHRSVPVGLSVGALPHHQGSGEDAHALDLGATFRVLSTSRTEAARRSCPRSPGSRHVWIVSTLRFMCCTKGAFFVTRATTRSFERIARPASFATRPSPWTASTPVRITPNFCGASASRTPSPAAGLHHQQLLASGRHHLRALQKPLAGGTLPQVDQAASSDQAVLRHVGERGEDAWRSRSTSSSPSSRSASDLDASLYTLLHILSVTLRKCPYIRHLREAKTDATANNQPIEFIRFLTGH